MSDKPPPTGDYGAVHIQVLSGLTAVRKRPGMYIGNTDDGSGLHHMVYEVVDHAIDEALAGFVTELTVSLNADGSVTIRDNGRGFPTDAPADEGVSVAELVMTQLYAGNRLGGRGDDRACRASCGLHGVGLAVVNALCARLVLRIWRDSKEHVMRFRDGVAEAPIEVVGPADGKRGIEVTFSPSLEVFRNVTELDYATLERRLRQLAFLNPGLRVVLKDHRGGGNKPDDMCYRSGIADFVRYIDRSRTPHLQGTPPVVIAGERDDIHVEAALWWNDTHEGRVLCFTNFVRQRNGGSHLAGFHAALARVITKCAEDSGIADGDRVAITGDDARAGLTAVLSLRVPDPRFSGQNRDELVSSEAKAVVESIVGEGLATWFEAHPRHAKAILAKAGRAASARALCEFVLRAPAGRA